jgi:hypothetical protein
MTQENKKKVDFHKIGKSNKKRGYRYEKLSADFWSKELNLNIKPTPRSGGYGADFPADLICIPASDKWQFIVDIKSGKTALPKRIENELIKLDWDSQGKIHWLELCPQHEDNPVCVIRRKDLAKLIKSYI